MVTTTDNGDGTYSHTVTGDDLDMATFYARIIECYGPILPRPWYRRAWANVVKLVRRRDG